MAVIRVLFLAYAYLCISIVAGHSANIWLPDFTNLFWTASVVTPDGKYLYIDGGEIWDGIGDSGKYGHAFGSTVAIDLTKSWTNTTLPVAFSAKKPASFPFSRRPTVWFQEENQAIFSYGGLNYAPASCNGNAAACSAWAYDGTSRGTFFDIALHPSQKNALWQLSISDSGAPVGSWKPSPSHLQPGDIALPTFGSLSTTMRGQIWSLGGLSIAPFSFTGYTIADLVHFDGRKWSDYSTNPSQYATLGGAAALPSFGNEGVIIYWGGFLSGTTFDQALFPNATHIRDMSEVSILDVASNQYYRQHVSGSLPSPRHTFCYVNVADNHGNVDIFMYGGQDQYGDVLKDMWVLSIPSFHWTPILNPKANAPKKEDHTCSVIGQRQMVSVGGTDGAGGLGTLPAHPDPFTNGIGVFDMSTFAWVSEYDPHAEPYERQEDLAKSLKNMKYPDYWTEKGTAQLFVMPEKQSSNSSSSLSGGAIAGIVIGIIAIVVIVGVILFLFRRRRQRAQKQQQEQKTIPEETKPDNFTQSQNPPNVQSHSSQLEKARQQERTELPGDQALAQLPDDAARSELPSVTQGEVWEMRTKRDTLLTPGDIGSDEDSGSGMYISSAGTLGRLNGDSGASTQVSATGGLGPEPQLGTSTPLSSPSLRMTSTSPPPIPELP